MNTIHYHNKKCWLQPPQQRLSHLSNVKKKPLNFEFKKETYPERGKGAKAVICVMRKRESGDERYPTFDAQPDIHHTHDYVIIAFIQV